VGPGLLRLELGELKLGGFDLSLTGFGDLELKDLMAERTAGLTAPHFPSLAVRAPARERWPEIKGRGQRTRSSAGRSIG
jgi:hypothetical protein